MGTGPGSTRAHTLGAWLGGRVPAAHVCATTDVPHASPGSHLGQGLALAIPCWRLCPIFPQSHEGLAVLPNPFPG